MRADLVSRYAAEGEAGLVDRSSRPHTSPRRTSAEMEDRIVAVRTCERRGPPGSAPSWACRPARCLASLSDRSWAWGLHHVLPAARARVQAKGQHLGLTVPWGSREEEVGRAVELAGTHEWDVLDDVPWVSWSTLSDPEGNPFCIAEYPSAR